MMICVNVLGLTHCFSACDQLSQICIREFLGHPIECPIGYASLSLFYMLGRNHV